MINFGKNSYFVLKLSFYAFSRRNFSTTTARTAKATSKSCGHSVSRVPRAHNSSLTARVTELMFPRGRELIWTRQVRTVCFWTSICHPSIRNRPDWRPVRGRSWFSSMAVTFEVNLLWFHDTHIFIQLDFKYHICRNKRPGRLIFRSNNETFPNPSQPIGFVYSPFEKSHIKAHWFCVLPPWKNHCFW